MSADERQQALPKGPWFTDGHQEALIAADIHFGSYLVLMFLVGLLAWHGGAISGIGLLGLAVLPLANFTISIVSMRARNAFAVETFRMLAGFVLAPIPYAMVDGAMAHYWPSFVVMMMGGVLLLGITGQRMLWSRLFILVHVTLLLFTGWLFPPRVELHSTGEPTVNWYQLLVEAGAIGIVGLFSARGMGILGKALTGLRERSAELASARDALFAELNVAHEIQTLLLPRDPRLPDSTVTGRMVPAKEVGGDYYDVIDLDGRRAFLAMGDVSGHGLTSGLTMMMARTALLGILEARPDATLVETYRALNRCLRHNLARMGLEMYMTFVLLESHGAGRFEAVGQHLPLLIYRRQTGVIEEIELEGVWLGLVEDLTPDMLPPVTFTLQPGDLLILYTDGIVEHFAGREMFGYGRFKDLLRQNASLAPGELIEATLSGLRSFSGEQRDDITMLIVNHEGSVQDSLPARATASGQ